MSFNITAARSDHDAVSAASLGLLLAVRRVPGPRPINDLPFFTLRGSGNAGPQKPEGRLAPGAALTWLTVRWLGWPPPRQADAPSPATRAKAPAGKASDVMTPTSMGPPSSPTPDAVALFPLNLKGGQGRAQGSHLVQPVQTMTAGLRPISNAATRSGARTSFRTLLAPTPVDRPIQAGSAAAASDAPPPAPAEQPNPAPSFRSLPPDLPDWPGLLTPEPSALASMTERAERNRPASTVVKPAPTISPATPPEKRRATPPEKTSVAAIPRDESVRLPLRSAPERGVTRINLLETRAAHPESISRPPIPASMTQSPGTTASPFIPPDDMIWHVSGRAPLATAAPARLPPAHIESAAGQKPSAPPGTPQAALPHRLPGGVEKWKVIIQTIEQRITREVAAAVKQDKRTGQPPSAAPNPAAGTRALKDPDDDRTAYRLLRKMRRLGQQERFRMGQIR